jgi:hypothetical protein
MTVLENWKLEGISGQIMDNTVCGWGTLHIEDLHSCCSSSNVLLIDHRAEDDMCTVRRTHYVKKRGMLIVFDRLCSLEVRVPGCRS